MGNRVVYQPAYEAEVEYLESTGTQWIDTGVKPDNTYTFDCKVAVTQDSYNCVYWGARNSGNSNSENNQCYLNSNNISGSIDRVPIHLYSTSINASSNWSSNVIPSVNTMYELTGMTVVSTMNPMIYPITLFAFNMIGDINAELGKCRIGYWKCYSNGHVVRDFIPVRIGATGYMYDKVSRQLFANAGAGRFVLGNDVANATVPQLRHVVYFGGQRCVGFEKVYEKCAWLKGRNGAYIDTNYYPVFGTDVFDCHFRYDGTMRNPDGLEQNAFGVIDDGNYYVRAYVNGVNNLAVNYFKLINQNFPATIQAFDADICNIRIVDSNNFAFTINGSDINKSYEFAGVKTLGRSCYVFFINSYHSYDSKKYLHGDIAYFRITDATSTITRVNMFPCRLLVDIPAILDGNGIARQAGTCGMWDTVSGRFFGNVADRGSFDVVYFEEGVDYEVHQWLVGEISSKGTLQRLPINSSSMSYRAKRINGVNLHFFRTEGNYDYYYATSNYRVSIWDLNQSTFVYRNQSIKVDEFDFECSAGNVYINGVDIPIYGFPIKEVRFHGADNGGMKISTSSITVDGIERYIPVKLLRSIPSRYDANGIARQAGECGMYDTVNDLFYGNVASGGTFSVSDDE